jgi:hypothetical protein
MWRIDRFLASKQLTLVIDAGEIAKTRKGLFLIASVSGKRRLGIRLGTIK